MNYYYKFLREFTGYWRISSGVNKAGENFFKVYSLDGVHNQIGVTESGLEYISNNIENVRKN